MANMRKLITPAADCRCSSSDLLPSHCSELQYALENSQSAAILTTEQYADKMEPLASKANIQLQLLEQASSHCAGSQSTSTLRDIAEAASSHASEKETRDLLVSHFEAQALAEDNGALIVYTSGTTGRPKGHQ